jgi:cyclophilin family peptidyl-prolyl cis-trans isomerase
MGKNARRRKEQQIIGKYGQLPPEPKPIPWGKIVAGVLTLTLLGFALRDLNRTARPALASWWQSAQQRAAERSAAATASPSSEVKTAATESPIIVTNASPEAQEKTMIATMSTNQGDIKFELFGKEAPKTVENFTKLAEKGYYNGVIFHRIIKEFMIQGGDPTGTGAGGESIFGNTFEDEENDKKMEPGVIAMANRGPNTNGSQFFIVTESRQAHLEGRHTIFGKVVEGMDIVKKIAAVKVDGSDRPVEEVKITGIKIEEKK